ncbi:hypothetical protein [Burkholderia sp. Ac-20365]|uniref:hypothetical protein n=1 Tax=Burkholderia sp. Ac-20365 TaxID=2703897 RepID=UPI00197C5C14|nr:hypothetical protein [Burkholderia sp. Ac-20365]MBN3761103.1 hypothetical protein [Burkholderia sp. Ac-20365]
MDMQRDIFAEMPFGQIALAKLQPSNPNFRLYSAGWLETGGPPETWDEMAVTGAEFREAKSGPNKGKLSVMVPNTKRTVHVHRSEMAAAEKAAHRQHANRIG